MELAGERPVSLEARGGWGQTTPRKNGRGDLTPAWDTAGQDQDTHQSLWLLLSPPGHRSEHFDAPLAGQPLGSQLFWLWQHQTTNSKG